jgi:hypothetical protein
LLPGPLLWGIVPIFSGGDLEHLQHVPRSVQGGRQQTLVRLFVWRIPGSVAERSALSPALWLCRPLYRKTGPWFTRRCPFHFQHRFLERQLAAWLFCLVAYF